MSDASKYLDWVEFEDELPEIGVTVLAYNPVADRFSLITRYEHYYGIATSCCEGLHISPPERVVNLSHWMLLPFPPMSDELKRDIAGLLAKQPAQA